MADPLVRARGLALQPRDGLRPHPLDRLVRGLEQLLGPKDPLPDQPAVRRRTGLGDETAGVLQGEGMYLFRPSWIIDPYWALEGFAGLSPRSGSRFTAHG